MNVHVTFRGVIDVIGATVVSAFIIYLLIGLWVLLRWGK